MPLQSRPFVPPVPYLLCVAGALVLYFVIRVFPRGELMSTEKIPFGETEFADDPEPRCPDGLWRTYRESFDFGTITPSGGD
jgi:hypothetical protein